MQVSFSRGNRQRYSATATIGARMHFTQLLKSLDELLYEVMSWLVFYPLTLWRVLRHPLAMMDYSDRELHEGEAAQYRDTLRPPLFLLLTLLLSHGIELALVGTNPIVASKHGLASLVDDDTSLIMLRLVVFSVFPLVLATRLARLKSHGVTRETLRAPFYAQCYAAAPFALTIGLGTLLTTLRWDWAHAAGGLLLLAALTSYWIVQARWFAQHLHRSPGAGFGHAAAGIALSLLAVLLVAPLFA